MVEDLKEAVNLETQLHALESYLETRADMGKWVTDHRWKLLGLMDWLTPAESAELLESIPNTVVRGLKMVDVETVIDENGVVLELHFNLKEVGA